MTLIPIAFTAVASMLGQGGAAAAPKVAVVHVPVVSEKYERTRELEAQFDQKRTAFTQQRDAMKQKIERTNQSIQEEFKPGTAEYQEQVKQLAMLEAELKFFMESEGQKIEQGLAGSLRSIYNDIQAAVKEVADEKGIDIVLAADNVPPEPPTSTQQARQQIVLQKVLYWTPRVDITEEVVTRLNTRLRSSPPAGSAQPPPGNPPPKPNSAPAPKGASKP